LNTSLRYAAIWTRFGFADACLMATAYFLCASAANPLLAKISQPGTQDQIDQLERGANSTALIATGLALIFAIAGTLAFADETRERNAREDALRQRVTRLETASLLDQNRRDIEHMRAEEQNLDSKNEELKRLTATINERLGKIDEDLQKLQAGEARDARVADLLSRTNALAASVKKEADDINQQAKALDEHRKKIAEVTDTIAHRLVPQAQKSSARPGHKPSRKKL
jgi:predicted RNase H-like nuclease (RuvC/YqgF family)